MASNDVKNDVRAPLLVLGTSVKAVALEREARTAAEIFMVMVMVMVMQWRMKYEYDILFADDDAIDAMLKQHSTWRVPTGES